MGGYFLRLAGLYSDKFIPSLNEPVLSLNSLIALLHFYISNFQGSLPVNEKPGANNKKIRFDAAGIAVAGNYRHRANPGW